MAKKPKPTPNPVTDPAGFAAHMNNVAKEARAAQRMAAKRVTPTSGGGIRNTGVMHKVQNGNDPAGRSTQTQNEGRGWFRRKA